MLISFRTFPFNLGNLWRAWWPSMSSGLCGVLQLPQPVSGSGSSHFLYLDVNAFHHIDLFHSANRTPLQGEGEEDDGPLYQNAKPNDAAEKDRQPSIPGALGRRPRDGRLRRRRGYGHRQRKTGRSRPDAHPPPQGRPSGLCSLFLHQTRLKLVKPYSLV